MESKVVWREGMAFEAHLDGFQFIIDAAPEVGGTNLGPRPKGLTLTSLAGCTAMDVISILTKMKQPVATFEVEVVGDLVEDHPRRFDQMLVRYRLTGEGVDPGRVLRAVELSEERYCGVSATLRPSVKLHNEVWLNGVLLT